MILMAKAIFIICTTLAGQPPAARSGPVDFYKEEISMAVDDSTVSIHGVYYFRNNTDRARPFPVVFPFYTDSLTSFPNKISAYMIVDTETTTVNYEALIEHSAIRMGIPMTPKGVTVWYLDYTQNVKSSRARYILTSTAAWKKPLEEATYYFVLPAQYNIVTVWPEPDNTEIAGERKILRCERKNFMPERDMEIIWERK